ncbi:MAG: hypothetical protein ACOX8C_17930 [Saccharomonospora viridis]|jgi:hypothetical protein|uniref:hypothetical protein n=1 Tax=Saccharomonospora viridis TaxID=1852 RepID=UPI003D94BD5D
MANDSLIAPVESTREAWTCAGLADGIEGLVDAIKSEGWVHDLPAGSSLAVEGVATVLDPFSALLANGLGWAVEYFEPLREMLDELAGKPDVGAVTLRHLEQHGELHSMAADLHSCLEGDLSYWQDEGADAYRAAMASNVDGSGGGLAAISAAMAVATEGSGGPVALTRDIVRDLIADLVARVIVWAVEALFVVTIPVVAAQIAAAVVKWSACILTYTTALIDSLTNFTKLLND